MKSYMLRYNDRDPVEKVGMHSVKILFLFDVIQIEDGVETVLENKFPIVGAVSDIVINMFNLSEGAIAEAALSCVVRSLKTEPNVKAVVNKEYMLGTQHLLNDQLPPMENETEFSIHWDN
ncbi:hypothetical protein P4E94_18980 [Pontiellaceae bacterium B12219]|nr:hypothetical protein [Pontiellaceae bacterium B12219]